MKRNMLYLAVFFIAMLPIVELRGAIPYAQLYELDLIPSYIIAVIGNMIPVPFIYLFARKILAWGQNKKVIGKFCSWLLNKGHKGGEKLKKAAGRGLFVALVIFVGIPLPGTGAWTGALAASILDMGLKKSSIAVMLGVMLAGVIMALIGAGLLGGLSFMLK